VAEIPQERWDRVFQEGHSWPKAWWGEDRWADGRRPVGKGPAYCGRCGWTSWLQLASEGSILSRGEAGRHGRGGLCYGGGQSSEGDYPASYP
jgi:hypothetical protein